MTRSYAALVIGLAFVLGCGNAIFEYWRDLAPKRRRLGIGCLPMLIPFVLLVIADTDIGSAVAVGLGAILAVNFGMTIVNARLSTEQSDRDVASDTASYVLLATLYLCAFVLQDQIGCARWEYHYKHSTPLEWKSYTSTNVETAGRFDERAVEVEDAQILTSNWRDNATGATYTWTDVTAYRRSHRLVSFIPLAAVVAFNILAFRPARKLTRWILVRRAP